VKNNFRAILIICACGAVTLLLSLGLTAYLGRQQTALLSRPPEHGTSLVIEADLSQVAGNTNALANLKETLMRRFDKFGGRIFWESVSGSRIRVNTLITDEKELALVKSLLSRTGHLEFRLVHEKSDQLILDGEVPADYELLKHEEVQPYGPARIEMVVAKKKPEAGLAGDIVKSARAAPDQMGQSQIYFELNRESATAFGEVTRENIDRKLAIVLDGQLYSAPIIKSPIDTGFGEIAGSFSVNEASLLAILMEYPLPIPVTVVDSKTF
jgi:preprotein translocase subunit SecD